MKLAGWTIVCLWGTVAGAAEWKDLGSDELERYFAQRVASLEHPLRGITTVEEWQEKQPVMRRELLEMLGLSPMPERTPLQATVTGTLEHAEFTVEKLQFQSSPGLYVTANFYLPRVREGKVPAVLYVCGHGPSKKDGVSFGNKVSYQHHGIWFARNGYACLVIDTIHLGEIEAIHHGTYRYDRWWWHARGYTPAGVEAWNCVRALDYLQSRAEVDGARLGVTGRSGGGAYSWWIAAIDERIKAAVPVAGITSLRNHVVDGCVEGHCDCMYHLNTHRWDFEEVAALVAPRPLLISNTDKDSIFPLDGVYHVYRPVRRIYELSGAAGKLGLNIEEGPHKDTQPLRTSAFHWMNRHLKGTEPADSFGMAAEKMFEPEELKVFAKLPADEINTRIDEVFVPRAPAPEMPDDVAEWQAMKTGWMKALQEKCFAGWPAPAPDPQLAAVEDESKDGIRVRVFNLKTEPEATCWLAVAQRADSAPGELKTVRVTVFDEASWTAWKGARAEPARGELAAYFCPRGTGERIWTEDKKKQVQIRRRFALVGETLDGAWVHDIRQGIRAVRGLVKVEAEVILEARGTMAGNLLYATLFLDRPVHSLTLRDLPDSHRDGPFYLNVLKFMDLPQAVAMAAERSAVTIIGDTSGWEFPMKIATKVDWPAKQLVLMSAEPASQADPEPRPTK